MIFTSRGIALLLGAAIASMATAFLFVFQRTTGNVLVAVFVITFFSAFVLIAVALQSLIFRPIKKLGRVVDKLAGKGEEEGKVESGRNPLEVITDDVRSFADRTEREIEEHKKLEAFRREFIADVSHELKTPIFAAQGFVHTLLDGAMKDKAVREKFLRKAAKSLDGLDMLVQDLLTLSQLETGQIKMHIEEVDLLKLTQEVLEQFEGKSQKKKVELRIQQPAGKVMVYADAQRISQVMTNLISNAIKHSADEHEVIIRFTEKKKWIITSVIDSGEGIAEEHLPRIFERFYRIDKSRSREKGGTGLGLAIVKHILEGHRSKPRAESVPGQGSTFSFRLRRVKAEKSKNGDDNKPAEDQGFDS